MARGGARNFVVAVGIGELWCWWLSETGFGQEREVLGGDWAQCTEVGSGIPM